MTADDLRAVLLWRAVEGPALAAGAGAVVGVDPAGPGLAAGRAAAHDRADWADWADWAGLEARRRLGEQAAPERWLAERARLQLARLAQQQPAWRPMLAAAQTPIGRGWGWALLLGAALTGALGEHLGSARFVHLLAPPLLGLLLWNLAVYLLLAVQALRRRGRTAHAGARPAAGGPVRRALLGWAARGRGWLATTGLALDAPRAGALARFQRDWLAQSADWQAARGVAWLHGAAAALALGALVSWYARGLVLDYRAGWDSTFLDAGQVRLLLGGVLGPAAALAGQALPDAAALAALRVADGGGEPAARWIHLWSLTLLAVVVLPRLALAGWSAWRARRLAGHLPLPDDDALRRLLRGAAGEPLAVLVLPYSYRLDAAREAALRRRLDDWWGPGLQLQLLPSLPMGAEDDLAAHLPAALPARVVVLFALTATPERETHGALLAALGLRRGAGAEAAVVLVDESGFRQRLGGAARDDRLAQRRALWQALMAGAGSAPRFVDLAAPEASR